MPDQANRLRILQMYLRDTGRYHGDIDGDFGPLTRNAVLAGDGGWS
jgi:peptidoglycan hydrolase-like protein with peptidoglycan-binding domain